MSEYRTISAKFASKCAETGKDILAGEKCLFDIQSRKVYHKDSEAYKNNLESFKAQKNKEDFF